MVWKLDRPAGGRRLKELSQDGEDALQVGIVFPDLALQRLDLPRKLFVGGKELPQMDESPDYLDAGADRHDAFEDVREHHRPVFGEDARRVLQMLSAL